MNPVFVSSLTWLNNPGPILDPYPSGLGLGCSPCFIRKPSSWGPMHHRNLCFPLAECSSPRIWWPISPDRPSSLRENLVLSIWETHAAYTGGMWLLNQSMVTDWGLSQKRRERYNWRMWHQFWSWDSTTLINVVKAIGQKNRTRAIISPACLGQVPWRRSLLIFLLPNAPKEI